MFSFRKILLYFDSIRPAESENRVEKFMYMYLYITRLVRTIASRILK